MNGAGGVWRGLAIHGMVWRLKWHAGAVVWRSGLRNGGMGRTVHGRNAGHRRMGVDGICHCRQAVWTGKRCIWRRRQVPVVIGRIGGSGQGRGWVGQGARVMMVIQSRWMRVPWAVIGTLVAAWGVGRHAMHGWRRGVVRSRVGRKVPGPVVGCRDIHGIGSEGEHDEMAEISWQENPGGR